MSTGGWIVSDSAQVAPQQSDDGGWSVSDSAEPAKNPAHTSDASPATIQQGPQQTLEPPEERTVSNYAQEAAEGVGRGLKNVAGGIVSAFAHPVNTAEAVTNQVFDQAIPAAQKEFQETQGADLPSRLVAAGLSGAEQLPVVGQPIQKMETGYFSPEAVGGAAELGTMGLAPEAAKKGVIEPVTRFVKGRQPVTGQNYTPRQQASHAAVIAHGNAGGDAGYIPQDLSKGNLSRLRTTAAANPAEVNAIRKGAPNEALGAHQSLLDKAKADIDTQHETALQPVENNPANANAAKAAITPSSAQQEGISKGDMKSIQDLQDRADNIKTLRGLNEFRKYLNEEDTTLKNNMAPGQSGTYPQLVHRMANAAREDYYDQLQKATGQDFTQLKRDEGNIIAEKRGLQGAGSRLASGEAKASAPQSARGLAADIAEGAVRGNHPGIPVVGAFAERLRGSQLGQIQQHLQRMYSDLPQAPAPARVPQGAFVNRARTLPSSTVGQGTATPATRNPAPPAPTALPTPLTAQSTPQAVPNVLQPAPEAASLPPQPAQPRLNSPAFEETPQPAPKTPPPVNSSTAREQIGNQPTQIKPTPAVQGRTTVSPEGAAQRTLPESRQLNAPIKAPKSGKTVKVGDTVTVSGKSGVVVGQDPQTGKVKVNWLKGKQQPTKLDEADF